MLKMDWKKFIPHISIIVILLITSIVLFPESFSGKVVQQPDMLNFKGIGSDAIALRKETGEVSVWTNSSFSGMPTYVWGGAPYTGNKLRPLQKYVVMLGMPSPPARFFGAFLAFFLLTLVLRINPWVGLIGSLAFGLSTYNFLISEAGHGSKFLAIIYFPLIAAGAMLVYRAKYILGSLIFGLGLGLDLMAGHIQMTYYFAICMAIFVIAKLVEAIRKKELAQFGKASLILLIPLMLAVGSNASRLWTSFEYMKETIRGPQILNSAQSNSKSGLDKDYVFNWSHGVGESVSFIIPSAFGGGSVQPMDESFATYKDLRKKGVSKAGLKSAPLYWGDMPSTSGPIYFGAVAWLLFIFGLLLVKGPLKWWLVCTTALVIMLSWGKNFMGFNELFYNYFPMYDKFRSVNSILAVLQFTVPFLGVLALSELVKEKLDREALIKKLYIALGVTGGFVIFFGLFGSAIFDFEGGSDARIKQSGYNLAAIISDRKMMLQSDAFRSLLFILMASGLIWMFLKEKFIKNIPILFGIMALLMLIDLGGVGKRYLNSDNFVKAKRYDKNFNPRPVDNQILQDKDPHYRVFDMSINTFNSNRASNHHKTIGGYHAAKLRRYQDIIEKQIGVGNQKVYDMLNTKYVITQDQKVQQNPGALGNAWFVRNVQEVNSGDEEMNALNDIDPRQTAVVHSEFKDMLGGFTTGTAEGSIQLKSVKPNEISYTSNSSSDQIAVFSEVIYKPNQSGGWQSFIDGKPADHFRANYILRAMKIPAGQHTIEFKFKPPSYYTGEIISLICSLILILGFLAYMFLQWKKSKDA
jgi:hypothetical protein